MSRDPSRSRVADRPHPPSVDAVLSQVRASAGAPDAEALTAVTREVIQAERQHIKAGYPPSDVGALARTVTQRLEALVDPAAGLITVINATGVILHTNLGRAPWPAAAVAAANRAATAYSLLEFDRSAGRRGQRFRAAEEHLIALTGADDAIITVNNAAALLLAVALAGRRGVAVSRGELVEIGGGVRIPEIIRRAGARLIEVGTTNRTLASDFEAPLADGRAAAVLRVHPSNFTQSGFVAAPDPVGVAVLAHRHGAFVIDDLGSGAFQDTAAFGLAHEPTPRERLDAGADIVTFSGDKLVGGPQAGLIVGRGDLIAKIRRDPLARAVRPDKVTLAGVAATLGLYRAGRATVDIPIWSMIGASRETLRGRAETIARRVSSEHVAVTELTSTVGGGSLPGETLPSVGLRVFGLGAARLARRLREAEPSVIGRIEADAVLLDLRTVLPSDDRRLAGALAAALP
jgi:L-seryl-tRNA(Ser) seleniumtransferase